MEKESILLDVFTDTPYAGNRLAVFPSADDLNTEQMQKLANEINYSETTFIQTSPDIEADFDIRIFTPNSEMPFAGHPTLGTAYAILNKFDGFQNKNTIRLRTKVGIIPLKKQGDNIWMRQNIPEFFNTYENKSEIAESIGLGVEDISEKLPIEEVSTGNTIMLIPVKDLSSIRKAVGNMNMIEGFFKNRKAIGPYLFTFETEDPKSKVHTRFFAPHLGIIEDPATGSAAGPLTGYLLKHKIFGDNFEIQNEQGIEMGRPSQIQMRGSTLDGEYKIEIGGRCCFIGRSEFFIL